MVIITGSTRGIGFAIAKMFALKGHAVIINGRKEAAVKNGVQQLLEIGGQVYGVTGDVAHEQTGERLIHAAITQFGKATVLINNAGIVRDRMSYKMEIDEWDEVMNVNLRGAFICTKPFVQHVKETGKRGTIINMISTAGLEGVVGQVNYSAAKAGLIGMTFALAKELHRFNIRVMAVAPSALTDMTRPHIERAKEKARAQGMPLDPYWQVGEPEDVAQFIYRLCERPSIEDSGQIFQVNGKVINRWSPPKKEAAPSWMEG